MGKSNKEGKNITKHQSPKAVGVRWTCRVLAPWAVWTGSCRWQESSSSWRGSPPRAGHGPGNGGLGASLARPPEPQACFMGTGKAGANLAEGMATRQPGCSHYHFPPHNPEQRSPGMEGLPRGSVLTKTPCLRQPATCRAEPSSFPGLCCQPGPGKSRKRDPGLQDWPSPHKPRLGMATAFFPAHTTALSSLKRKKCFLNKINNPHK